MIKYSLVIPFFNEEKNIKQVLQHLSKVNKKIKKSIQKQFKKFKQKNL